MIEGYCWGFVLKFNPRCASLVGVRAGMQRDSEAAQSPAELRLIVNQAIVVVKLPLEPLMFGEETSCTITCRVLEQSATGTERAYLSL